MIRDKDQLPTDDSINTNQINRRMIDESDEENETILEASEAEPETTTRIDEETNCLIDVLHLQMLQLMEEHIGQQLTLETHTSRARLILARNRLQQGSLKATAASQLPAHTPYRALCRVVKEGIDTSLKLLRFDVAVAKGFLEPVTHIFGSLVPYSLRLASRKWERCVEQIVECVNVQRELQSVIRSIDQLKWARHKRRIELRGMRR